MPVTTPLLLTSAGITNPSLLRALEELLPRPISECNALAIPTSSYGHPNVSPQLAWKFLAGIAPCTGMVDLGWKSVGILELTAIPSIGDDRWVSWVTEADVLLVNGGDPLYLAYHMRASGFADLLPTLEHTVYVGLSAGSMIMAPRIGADSGRWRPPTGGDTTLGFVDFAIYPHLDNPMLPDNTMANAELWAATMAMPCYAIDDATGIRVVDGAVDVVSEGSWKLLNAPG
ncbi:MAG TPA: Type 1 glutamine amidotransferase-like domain-containing protein [Candidatus Limnocylindrales bacterium]|nr:Type 1 glutamine amidotransferase-like domain-containing protein [Candidatus Limnocylindrales bacterium]